MNKRSFSIALIATAILIFAAGCSQTKKLTLKVEDTGSFSFIDSSSKQKISYSKLMIDGEEVYDTDVSSAGGFGGGVYFSFSEQGIVRTSYYDEDRSAQVNRVEYGDGTVYFVGGNEWSYTLVDGVLDISK